MTWNHYCNEYKDGTSISFDVFGVKNAKSKDLNVTKFTIKIGVFNTWINLNKESSSRTVTLVDNAISAVKDGTSKGTSYNPTITVSGVVDLPAKGALPFTTVRELPVYAYISYTVKINGQTITKEFILKYDYNDYMIEKTIIDAGTANETFIKPSAGKID